MQNYILRLILFCLALTCRNITWADPVLTGRTITTGDGLPSNLVHDIAQDNQGYIWMATPNGLCRYDGYSFINFETIGCGDNEVSANVGTLTLDADNHLLWIRSATFYHACYDLDSGRFIDINGSSGVLHSFSYFAKEPHGLWLYDREGLVRHVVVDHEKRVTIRDYPKASLPLHEPRVRKVMVDSLNNAWLLTTDGLLRVTSSGQMQTLAKGRNILMGNWWKDRCFFLTQDFHVLVFNLQGQQIKETAVPPVLSFPEEVNGNFVWNGRWVMMTRTRVITMDCRNLTFEKPQELQMEYGILLDRIGDNYWVADKNGLLRLFSATGEIKDFRLLRQDGYNVSRKRMYSTILGNDGLFYIATYGNGLFIYNPKNGDMRHLSASDNSSLLATDYLIDIMSARDGNIWVSQENAGIVCLHRSTQPAATQAFSGHVAQLALDNNGKLMVDPRENERKDSVLDHQGRMWIATWEKGLLMSRQGQEPQQFLSRTTSESRLNALALDRQQRLWIATYNGLYMIDTKAKTVSNDDFRHYGRAEGITASNLSTVLVAADGTIWTGGQGTGLLRCELDKNQQLKISSLRKGNGLASDNVHSLVQDRYGYIWAATDNALARVNPKTMKVSSYHFGTSLLNSLYSYNCALALHDGRLAFGTYDGVTIVTPMKTDDAESTPLKVTVTDLEINGKSVFSDEQYGAIRSLNHPVSLSHGENSLVFHFSNFDYGNPERTTYQYYLKGLDKDWREPSTQHSVEYGNLPPGRYEFHLRTIETAEETVLQITIRQPWYNTWWAWMIYLIILGAIGWTYYRYKREKFKMQQQMAVAREVNEFRTNFFTQVAHEFRTPLAIISGAVDKMSDGAPSRKTIQLTQRGVKRLSTLVNQLMEFRKVQTGNLRLQVEQGDIVGFVRDICQDFWHVAEQKKLSLTFTPFTKKYTMLFDRHIVDTIVYNLVSNAVKYTPQGGSVMVRLKQHDDQVMLMVEDSGKGIDKDRQAKLFMPFMHGYASQGGMGIGLYTAHRMAQTHKGSLSYEPSEALGGSSFTLVLPTDEHLYSSDEYAQITAIVRTEEKESQTDLIIREMLPKALNDKHVVIIEDEPDMLEQIKTEMAVYFHVSGYTDGQTGFDHMQQERPSLLICDVMLPDTSGYDIVKRMKADASLRNVPVIMLTALDDERHQIKGYEAGVDDYMVKPCNYHILIARAVQLIKWTEENGVKTERQEGDGEQVSEGTTILTSQADKRFLERLNMLIAQHLSDPDFGIDQLAESMKMGRTKFYGKVKDLTGLSPNKLFMSERMRKAAALLDEGELNISEIGFRVGIPDPSYFNRCFKQHFGVTPGQYQKNK
ncbi:MAG: response regulator [Prevotella sp.]|nr:response regulator [Prevotella sp.]